MGEPSSPLPGPGWYPDPATGQQRYWDGAQWGPFAPPTAPGPLPFAPPPVPAGVVVTGPNHAVHAILSILTFWMCGGWIWVWLIVALVNNKHVRSVDAYGRTIVTPRPPRQGPSMLEQVGDKLAVAGGKLTDDQGQPVWSNVAIAVGAALAVAVILLVLIVVVVP
jgi:hypothetical protein